MVRIELAVPIQCRPEDVFELLTDLERLSEWQSSVVESRADGPLAEGSRIVEKRHVLGRNVETELEVTAFDPPWKLTLKTLRGPVRFTIVHELVEDGDGTLVRVVAEGEAGGFMKLARPLLARTAEHEMRRDFDRLKELAEGG